MKRVIAIMMAGIMLCFSMSGCSVLSAVFGASGSTAGTIKAEDGYAEGRIGDTLKTTFFTFRVESAQFVKEYAGYQPEEGNILVDSVVTVKNVFGEDLPMFNSDFQIQWGDGDDDFGYGVEGLEDSTIMPEEYTLKRGESVEYHIVYEVPKGSTDFSISYLEIFSDQSEGDVFFVYFEL